MKCEICNELFVHSDKQEEICPDCEQEIREGTENIFLLPDEAAIVFRNNGDIGLVIPNDSGDKLYSDLYPVQIAADLIHLLVCEPRSIEILDKAVSQIQDNI